MLDPATALQRVDELRLQRDPELLLLKGHVLLERFLVAAVAARLNCSEQRVPRLKLTAFAQLAFDGEEERRRVLWLNDLRNAVAHEFDALDSPQFQKILRRFDVPWPGGTLERGIVLEQLLVRAIHVALLKTLDFVLERPQQQPGEEFDMELYEEITGAQRDVRKRLAATEENIEAMRRQEWDALVGELRVGWQARA